MTENILLQQAQKAQAYSRSMLARGLSMADVERSRFAMYLQPAGTGGIGADGAALGGAAWHGNAPGITPSLGDLAKLVNAFGDQGGASPRRAAAIIGSDPTGYAHISGGGAIVGAGADCSCYSTPTEGDRCGSNKSSRIGDVSEVTYNPATKSCEYEYTCLDYTGRCPGDGEVAAGVGAGFDNSWCPDGVVPGGETTYEYTDGTARYSNGNLIPEGCLVNFPCKSPPENPYWTGLLNQDEPIRTTKTVKLKPCDRRSSGWFGTPHSESGPGTDPAPNQASVLVGLSMANSALGWDFSGTSLAGCVSNGTANDITVTACGLATMVLAPGQTNCSDPTKHTGVDWDYFEFSGPDLQSDGKPAHHIWKVGGSLSGLTGGHCLLLPGNTVMTLRGTCCAAPAVCAPCRS